MPLDLNALLQRCADLQKAALSDLGITSDAKPFFFHEQGTYPFWVNRIGAMTLGYDSEDFDTVQVDVIMRLLTDHQTAGSTANEPETNLYLYIAQVLEYFNSRVRLMDTTFTSELLDLEHASIVDCRGFSIFRQDGASAGQQVGTEFTLRVEYQPQITQVTVN